MDFAKKTKHKGVCILPKDKHIDLLLRLCSALYGSENIPRLRSIEPKKLILLKIPELKMEKRVAEGLPI